MPDGPKEASPEDRALIAKLLKEGRVKIEPSKAEAIGRMGLGSKDRKPDFTLTKVSLETWGKFKREDGSGNDGGMEVSWETVSAGAGGITVWLKDGRLYIDNECMSREFIKEALGKLLEEYELRQRVVFWLDTVKPGGHALIKDLGKLVDEAELRWNPGSDDPAF